jgi:hypothetical protein
LRRTGKYGKEKDMLFSASRRTDIPTYYSEWLCNRLEAGNVCVRHDARRVTRYVFSREAVDCLVLWTKNPLPLLDRLALLRGWPCVFQFTLTGYGRDVEPGLPDKLQLVEAMKRLSEAFGSERVIWRYDPIFFSGAYSLSWHVRCFDALAERLEGVTRTCVVSFLDMYPKLRRRIPALGLCGDSGQARKGLLAAFAAMAERRGIRLSLCAEDVDVPGVVHAGCLSRELVERVAGCRLDVRPSQQRAGCKCVASVDVGVYGTCGNGCLYCYANQDGVPVGRGSALHDPASPLLVGRLSADDEVTDQRCASLKSRQFSLL